MSEVRVPPKHEETPEPETSVLGGWGINFVGVMACERNPGGPHLKIGGEVGAIRFKGMPMR